MAKTDGHASEVGKGMTKPYDVLTIGETMLRLSPPRWQRLEQADYLEIVAGGAESNLAVALSRMGLNVAWVSRMTDNPLGRRIVHTIRGQGVDVSHVVWTDAGRVGTYFVEFGRPPRAINVIYDRRGSAMSEMRLADVNPALLDESCLVHLSGITPALSRGCQELAAGVLRMAGERKVLRSMDVNYRAKLWEPAEARAVLAPLCSRLDVLFTTQEDAVRVFDCDRAPEKALERLQSQLDVGVAVMTLGEGGAMALDRTGHSFLAPGRPSAEVDPLGSGDAFAAGFLYMYLTKGPGDLDSALRFGASAAALKRTIPGDLAYFTLEEIRHSQGNSGEDIKR